MLSISLQLKAYNNGGCRGWSADTVVPWSTFGGMPQAGVVWALHVTFDDIDARGAVSQSAWPPSGEGELHWGLPDVGGRSDPAAQVLTLPLTADSMVGGATDCGSADGPDYFPTWGNRNWGTSPYVNVQDQWDVADWPCYSKYYAA